MTRRLAQAQQRLEDLQLRLAEADRRADLLPKERGAIVVAQLVVQRALRRLEVAVQGLLGPGRQLGGHELLRAPQDERPKPAGQHLQRPVVGLRIRRGRRREGRRRAEHAGIQKVEQAPQLSEMILDRRATEREPVRGLEEPRRLGRAGARVLDRLRLVENRVVERDFLESPMSLRSVPYVVRMMSCSRDARRGRRAGRRQ